jgi:hypothetical protein
VDLTQVILQHLSESIDSMASNGCKAPKYCQKGEHNTRTRDTDDSSGDDGVLIGMSV